jgi:hypothetical protein
MHIDLTLVCGDACDTCLPHSARGSTIYYSLLLYLNRSNINVAVYPCVRGGSKRRSDLNGIVCSIKTFIGG